MVLRWILLSLYFSGGFTEKNCNRPRVVFPAPVFGTEENLSFKECGFWDQQINKNAPWYGYIRFETYGCSATLISPTSLLTHGCPNTAEAFAKSDNKEDWKAELGKCGPSNDYVNCVKNGDGQIVKVKNVTKLNAPGYPPRFPLHVWKIEKAKFKENSIAPICISNNGNGRDFEETQQYTTFHHYWRKAWRVSAELKENFGPCLNQSWNFETCEKVHENFLCAKLSSIDRNREYLTHEEMARGKNRHFLRAFQVEYERSSAKFYYEIFPLLEEVVSLSGDIPMMPKIPPTNKKTVFTDGESSSGCGTVRNRRRRREDTTAAPSFISRGKNAGKKEHPWHAALVDGDAHLFCGGSLISRKAVLTAGHCMYNRDGEIIHKSEFFVFFGTSEMEKVLEKTDVIGRQRGTPSNVIVHPGYVHPKKDNDIAIILLKESGVDITSYVTPICLWKDDYEFSKVNNKTGKVTGWGYTEDGTRPNDLQVAELRLVPYQECFSMNSHFYNQYLRPGRNFCAGEKGVNTCQGDSGEGFAVAVPEDGRWYLRGVVSFGHTKIITIDGQRIEVCTGTYPSLYTDITYHMEWIVQNAGLSDRVQN